MHLAREPRERADEESEYQQQTRRPGHRVAQPGSELGNVPDYTGGAAGRRVLRRRRGDLKFEPERNLRESAEQLEQEGRGHEKEHEQPLCPAGQDVVSRRSEVSIAVVPTVHVGFRNDVPRRHFRLRGRKVDELLLRQSARRRQPPGRPSTCSDSTRLGWPVRNSPAFPNPRGIENGTADVPVEDTFREPDERIMHFVL